MYSSNIILKTIFTLIFVVVTYFIDNYYLFWLLSFYLLLLIIADKNLKALVVNFFLDLVLLFLYYNAKIRFLIIGITIVCFLVLYFTSFNKRDLWKLKYASKYKTIRKRKGLFMSNFKKYLENSNKERLLKYDYDLTDELIDAKLNSDADDLYRYSKVRFYGYGTTITSLFGKWTLYDLIYAAVSILVLVLIIIFW